MAGELLDQFQQENPFMFMNKYLGHKVLRSKPVKFFLQVLLVLIVGVDVVGTYLAIKEDSFQRHSCFILLLQPEIVAMAVSIDFINKFHRITLKLDMRLASEYVTKEVISEYRKAFHTSILVVVNSLASCLVVFMPVFGDEYTFNIVDLVIWKWVGTFSTALKVAACLVAILFSLGIAYPILCGIHWVLLAKIHMTLIIDKLERISDGFGDLGEETLIYNEFYQHVIYVRLRDCIKEHIQLTKFAKALKREMKAAICCILMASLPPSAFIYFIKNKISPRNNFRAVPVITFFCSIAIICSSIGQAVEDTSTRLFRTISNTPWVHFNQKNKKILIIFLMNAQTIELTSYNSVSLNNRLILSMYKCTYSLATVLYNLSNRNNV